VHWQNRRRHHNNQRLGVFNTTVSRRLVSPNTTETLLLLQEPSPDAQAIGKNVFRGLSASVHV